MKKFESMLRRTATPNLVFFFPNDFLLAKPVVQRLFQQVNERARRLFAGFLALSLTTRKKVSLAIFLGIDMKTMRRGISDLLKSFSLDKKRVRRTGGGRRSKEHEYPGFSDKLEGLTEDHLAGDPMNDKRWVRKSLHYFKEQLSLLGMKASLPTIRKYLRKRKIFLKSNKKVLSLQQHKDRDKQFQQINRMKKAFLKSGKPVISIDTKKKEKIGLFYSVGRLWKKVVAKVWDHDFPSLSTAKIVPFGIYDLKYNKGYIYCGTSYETSQFIVEMIVKWWKEIGRYLYPNEKNLLILCDAGGANSYRCHGWKYELQTQLAAVYKLKVTVCHYPSGASKWNPIEHRLFSFISINWAGEPLTSIKKMLNLINSTTTRTGLTVQGFLIEKNYEKGRKYTPAQMKQLPIKYMKILPQWNYTLLPS
ncbi:MAG: ISAzo13 family transposase [bacterium]